MKLERMMIDGVEYELTPVLKTKEQPTTDKKIYPIPDGIEFENIDKGRLGLWFGDNQCLCFGVNNYWIVAGREKESNLCHLEEVAFEDLKVGDFVTIRTDATSISDFNLIIGIKDDMDVLRCKCIFDVNDLLTYALRKDNVFYRVTVS